MSDDLIIRERREDDLDALVEMLMEQQPTSLYPHRWPLPFPPEDFIRREHELVAYVGQRGARLIGHVCVQSVAGSAGTSGIAEGELAAVWAAGHRVPVSRLAVVSALFTSSSARGTGAGGMLLDAAVTWMRAHDFAPCLDVMEGLSPAAEIYRSRGWVAVGHPRPAWLPESGVLTAMVLPANAP